jgi:hypothetical protein
MPKEYFIEQFRDRTKPDGVVFNSGKPMPIVYLDRALKLTNDSTDLYTIAVFIIKIKKYDI